MKGKTNNPRANPLAFRSEIRASGAGEQWNHDDDDNIKFQQFGWRCTNDENAYGEDVLIGNYNEKRFDIKRLLTDYKTIGHYKNYYETTYGYGYKNKTPVEAGQERLNLEKRILDQGLVPASFPAHQPSLDFDQDIASRMVTTSQLAYGVGTKQITKK